MRMDYTVQACKEAMLPASDCKVLESQIVNAIKEIVNVFNIYNCGATEMI